MLPRMWLFPGRGARRIRSIEPYWLLRNGIGDARPALADSIECDVAIIGAGITGALAADALARRGGRRIVMLDARDAGMGSTAAATALLQYEIDTHLVDLARLIGEERANQAYRASASSIDLLERRFPEALERSNYRRRASVYLAADERVLPLMQAEIAARRGIGIDCEWLDEAEVRRRYGCRRPGAILSPLGAEMDPLRFTRALISAAEQQGTRVFARTKVEEIEARGDGLSLRIRGGFRVDAAHVIVAAGFESVDFLPHKVADIDNTFALVTEPLSDRSRLETMPLLWESARPYLYIRPTQDGRLLVGGADVPFKHAAARDALTPRQIGRIAAQFRDLFGEELPPLAYGWAGSFAATKDGLPYVGHVPGLHPRLQFALCYGGNGITYSILASDILLAGIEGFAHPLGEVFGFARG
jgi:glycine/D-amino acid oxidase-like deaminating enzyme